MQKLIESSLAKQQQTGAGISVAQISKPLKAEKRDDAGSVLAGQPTKKEIKRLFKEERHVDMLLPGRCQKPPAGRRQRLEPGSYSGCA